MSGTVFFDVDTQIDFLYPSGALYAPGAEKIVDRVAALNRYAAVHGVPVISTMDAHAEDDVEFRQWPPHCVVETAGQKKPAVTLLDKRVTVKNDANFRPVGAFSMDGAQQILLEKQTLNCFDAVNLPAILERLAADRYVVYGVVTEICVKFAAFGLLETGKRVELVTDAVRSLSDAAAQEMMTAFTARGGILTASTEVMKS